MEKESLEEQLARLSGRLGVLEARLAGMESAAATPVARPEARPRAARGRPAPQRADAANLPWMLDAAGIEGLVDAMYRRAADSPLEALDFERVDGGCYLGAHCRNVARLAMFIAARHGFSEASIRTIGICGLLHDCAMQDLAERVVASARPLTDAEFQQVREHPVRSAEHIRRHYRFGGVQTSVVPLVVQQHHERADGTGYPHGLSGGQIHEFARVLAIADSYEAMTMPRPFRAGVHPAKAMRTLLLQGYRTPQGGMYDHRVLKTLVWSASLYPVGCTVNLSDGRGARVMSPTSDPKRPVVRVLDDAGKGMLMDLSVHRDVAILN